LRPKQVTNAAKASSHGLYFPDRCDPRVTAFCCRFRYGRSN
jgi:hypothetical protein